jgi:hypothetical protein
MMARKKKNKKNKSQLSDNNTTKKLKQKKYGLSQVELNELCSHIIFSKQKVKIIGNF